MSKGLSYYMPSVINVKPLTFANKERGSVATNNMRYRGGNYGDAYHNSSRSSHK